MNKSLALCFHFYCNTTQCNFLQISEGVFLVRKRLWRPEKFESDRCSFYFFGSSEASVAIAGGSFLEAGYYIHTIYLRSA